MSIKVRYFASLAERLGRSESELAFSKTITIREIWQLDTGGQPLPANTLSAVNMEYAGHDALVQDGAEVAFFPPITGG